MELSQLLREGTTDQHRVTEKATFVQKFMRGNLEKSAYTRHLQMLHGVYASMEKALASLKDNSAIKNIYFPELFRTKALEADLTFFGVPLDGDSSVARDNYVSRIEAISQSQPELLVAHAYVRYLGDLSGGQALGRVAGKMFGLTDQGLAFYQFKEITDIPEFKNKYRAGLDAVPGSEEVKNQIVREAIAAFEFNRLIFEELESMFTDGVPA